MIGTSKYLIVFLAALLTFHACQKDTDPNEEWVPGEKWVDARDGKSYGTVQIGKQVWMTENFNYLPDSGCWTYNNDVMLASTYGRLYDWETAVRVCPGGWHLPLQEEWEELIDHLGGRDVAGGKLKEHGTSHWESPNTGASNAVGFTALPGGYMWSEDNFSDLRQSAHFWSASRYGTEYIFINTVSWLGTYIIDYNTMYYRGCACSVRYIKD